MSSAELTPTLRWINAEMDGKLDQQLDAWLAADLSYDQISREFADLGFNVSRETLRRYVLKRAAA